LLFIEKKQKIGFMDRGHLCTLCSSIVAGLMTWMANWDEEVIKAQKRMEPLSELEHTATSLGGL
jgi:chitinase